MGFSQALSGLKASATNLDVIGNNISNSQTVGFKGSKAVFSDVFAGAKTGLGTRIAAVMQDFSTGSLESSGRNLDLAIDGEGFFRLIQNEQVVYSRNGQLSLNNEGYLVNAQGARLTGYPGDVGAGGAPQELQVPSGALQAKASTAVEATFNLDARTGVPAVAPFDQDNADTYSYANNVTLFDSQGKAHNTTLYFSKTGDNDWDVRMSRDGEVAPETGNLTFDENGVNDNPGALDFTFTPGGGVNPMNISLDLDDTTQFGSDFELAKMNQDGYAAGSLVGIAIDESGQIVGNYSNEQTQLIGTIAMADFANVEGLNPVGDNAWAETSASGPALVGLAGSGQLGGIESGVIETSNVDLTRELVDLIIAQRNYQANAQTVKVQEEVLQQAVNMG
ncbi:MAG: flagellar hook protein FlgE [Pseudohongiellaceae bacterium]